jgi:polyhydroxybutyrate depolymerase
MMTHRLGRELSTRITAIAPVIATVFGDEKQPKSPVAALMVNGVLDESVPYQGGAPGGRFARAWGGTPAQPALAQASFWAATNRCKLTPESIDQLMLVTWEYTCPANAAVKLVLVKDNGHAWPGGKPGSRRADTPSQSLNATNLIWDFFLEHQKASVKKVQQ